MKWFNKQWLSALAIGLASASAQGGLSDSLQGALKAAGGSSGLQQLASSSLSNSEMVEGMKEALAQGVQRAVETLGQTDGFLTNELVKISPPGALGMVEQTARKMGQGQYADEFVESMNRAAEQAVPEAAQILGDAIRAMSVEDAAQIINGPDDAATQYFRRVSEASLSERFLPLVKQATDQVGVTSAYKALLDQGGGMVGGLVSGLGLGGQGGLSQFGVSKEQLDLDKYVTSEALNGLFTYIAIEEKQIRENPLARSSELLKKVFSR